MSETIQPARLVGWPIHPMLVPSPIGCFVGMFLTDWTLAWLQRSNEGASLCPVVPRNAYQASRVSGAEETTMALIRDIISILAVVGVAVLLVRAAIETDRQLPK